MKCELVPFTELVNKYLCERDSQHEAEADRKVGLFWDFVGLFLTLTFVSVTASTKQKPEIVVYDE